MNRFLTRIAACAFVFALAAQAAFASTRSVGQTIVYDVMQASKVTSGVPAGIPAFARAQYEATQALAAKGQTQTFTFRVDAVNADGSAHLQGSIAGSGVDSKGLAVVPYAYSLQATLAADGRIVPTYDDSLPAETTTDNKYHSQVPTQASMENTNARRFPATEFNRFILGCVKRGALRTGDAWRIKLKDKTTQTDEIYDFAVTGMDAASGRDLATVTMKTSTEGSQSSQNIEATGHYDPTLQLAVDFHEESSYSQATPNGTIAGTSTIEFTLRR